MLSDLSLKQQNSHVEDHSATSSMNGNDRPAASSTGSGLAITEFVPGRDKWEGTAKDKEFDPFGSNNYTGFGEILTFFLFFVCLCLFLFVFCFVLLLPISFFMMTSTWEAFRVQ